MPHLAPTYLPRVNGGTTVIRDGIPGQSREVFGLWVRVCFHRGRTAFLRRKRFQERAQAMQTLQGKAEPDGGWSGSAADGNHDEVLAVWQGDHGSFPANSGSASALPRVFSATACHWDSCVILRHRCRASRAGVYVSVRRLRVRVPTLALPWERWHGLQRRPRFAVMCPALLES